MKEAHVESDAFNMRLDEKPELGKAEEDDNVVMVEADDVQEGSEGLSTMARLQNPMKATTKAEVMYHLQKGSIPMRQKKDVETETETAVLTPRKRKLAECADGILSTDDCPVCHTSDITSSQAVRIRRRRRYFGC